MTPSIGQQQSLVSIILSGSPIVQFVLLLLLAFSIGSLGVILYKFRQLRAARKQSERFLEIFWEAKNLAAISSASAELKQSPVAHVFRSGYQELQRFTRSSTKKSGTWGGEAESTDLGGIENVERAMRRATNQEVTRLEKALTFLATTASTSPFVGLFGTVWGIYHALTAIGIAGQASIDKVAGPVGEALIMTALGLAVAVPAVLGYNWLVRRNRVAMELIRHFGGGVHMSLIGRGGRTRRDSES